MHLLADPRDQKTIRATLIKLRKNLDETPAGFVQGIRGIIQIKGTKYKYEIYNDPIQIGRSPNVDIYLEDISISRIHATLLPLGVGHYGIRDEGSMNGTWIASRLKEHNIYPLHSGDTILIGKVVLIFTINK